MRAKAMIPSLIHSSSKMAVAKVILVLIIACSEILHVTADVIAISPTNATIRFSSLPANFGPAIPSTGLEGLLVVAEPIDACSPIAKAPKFPNITSPILYFALIQRGNCDFDQKVLTAQQANYQAAVVYNDDGDMLTTMSGKTVADSVVISSVFVGQSSGLELKGMNYTTGWWLHVYFFASYPWRLFMTFFLVLSVSSIIIVIFYSVAKYVRDQRRRRKARLSRDHLKKLPTKKFKKGDEYDVCAICLDDYEEGQKLRILPCNHAFHCKCIDPWLTNNRRTCPICKRKVVPPGMADSDADSDSDDGDSPTENTPLLASMQTGSSTGERGAVGGVSPINTPPPSPSTSINGDDHDPTGDTPVVALISVDSDSDSVDSFPMEEAPQDVQASPATSETVQVTVHSENETEPRMSNAVNA